jgi:hemerythrin-like domain-containing protein
MANPKKIRAVFLDIRDTLGFVDQPGHLITFKPSTEHLLQTIKEQLGVRIGLITNLPDNVPDDKGFEMIENAGIFKYVDRADVITNHQSGMEKPHPGIYEFAAKKLGLEVDECMFMGENLLEVIGAQVAGMNSTLKPFPPRRDFLFKPLQKGTGSNVDSGRLAEVLMEEDHLIGKRIVMSAGKIAALIAQGKKPSMIALGNLNYLVHNYIDTFHHRKEEEALMPICVSRGFPLRDIEWVKLEHDQGRAYFKGIDCAYKRMLIGDDYAMEDLRFCLEGFVNLYRKHGAREDNDLLPKMTAVLTDQDDALLLDLFERIGPGDLTPFLLLISQMEAELNAQQS